VPSGLVEKIVSQIVGNHFLEFLSKRAFCSYAFLQVSQVYDIKNTVSVNIQDLKAGLLLVLLFLVEHKNLQSLHKLRKRNFNLVKPLRKVKIEHLAKKRTVGADNKLYVLYEIIF
jgi:hypothetical protein